MSRSVSSRIIVNGTLMAIDPLHVGGIGGNEDVDQMIAINGQNEPYVPGTSIAGAVRGWLLEVTDQATVEELFGRTNSSGNSRSDEGFASYIIFDDGLIDLGDQTIDQILEVRDGVGIDRMTGTAAERVKYNRAVLPAGTRIALTISVHLPTQDDSLKLLLGEILEAMTRKEIRFGAAKSRGLGRVILEKEPTITIQDLSTPAGILSVLDQKQDHVSIANLLEKTSQMSSARPIRALSVIDVTVKWRPDGPLMVKSDCDGIAVDSLPLITAVPDGLTLVIPGSSIKGALRSHAERIMRTIIPSLPSKSSFLEQLRVPLVRELFGDGGEKVDSEKVGDDSNEPLPGLSALFVEDCHPRFSTDPASSTITFSRSGWNDVEQAITSSDLLTALGQIRLAANEHGSPMLHQAFHVAIDRWTGSAADGLLYSVLEPHLEDWNEIRLQVKLSRIKEGQRLAMAAFLLILLRDLSTGVIPLGYGTNRGMGSMLVTTIEIKVRNASDPTLELLDNVSITSGVINLAPHISSRFNHAWKQEIERIQSLPEAK